eukprot:jgi/Ulvmu1/4314/UM002_0035.1
MFRLGGMRELLRASVYPVRSMSRAVLALGGNVGNVADTFERSLQILEQHDIKVTKTSHLYKSAPMHVTEQPSFINAAAWVHTSLTASELLPVLKSIEADAGRKLDAQRWGPRPLDLDIIFFESQQVKSEVLTVPHPRWQERPFVCRPVLDLIDTQNASLPQWQGTWRAVKTAMARFRDEDSNQLQQLWPLRPGLLHAVGSSTLVMGILNVTPDSFSDGGLHASSNAAVAYGKKLLQDGAHIIDVGGQSTRPGSTPVSPAEEAARILPSIRQLAAVSGITISVDTYHADVAEAAVAAGAHIINDVMAGRGDANMLRTVARLGVPYIMMHSRGTAGHMHGSELTGYGELEVEVAAELQAAADGAAAAGVRTWNMMLDPGIGFGKSPADNLRLLSAIARIRAHLKGAVKTAPMLVGPSRKGFLGRVSARSVTADRDVATAAACTISIASGADAIRVHNVPAGADVATVCDAALRPL